MDVETLLRRLHERQEYWALLPATEGNLAELSVDGSILLTEQECEEIKAYGIPTFWERSREGGR